MTTNDNERGPRLSERAMAASMEDETARNLRQAHGALGQAHMAWKSGANASTVKGWVVTAERHIAAVRDRLAAHMGD